MPAGLDCPEASVTGLQVTALSRPLHVAVPLCTHTPPVCSSSFSYKDTAQIALGPNLRASFKLNHLFKGLIYKYSHIRKYCPEG